MTDRFRPLGDHVLLRPREKKYEGAIVIPETAKKEKPEQAEVLAVGPGMLMKNGERWPMGFKAGDVVVYNRHSGREVIVNDEKLFVIRDDDVLAVLE